MHQVPGLVVLQRLHKSVRHADRDVEVVPAPRLALGRDEFQHVRVVDAQHAHLRAAPRTRALDRGAGMVEHVHVAARTRGQRSHGLDLGAAWPDVRKVIADAAAPAHRLGGFAQRFVDARVARVVEALDAVAHRLHEAVDERGLDVGPGRAHDAARADRAGAQVLQKQGLVAGPLCLGFDRRQGSRDTQENILGRAFVALQVLLAQHILADGLGLDGRQGRTGNGFALSHFGSVHHEGPGNMRRIGK